MREDSVQHPLALRCAADAFALAPKQSVLQERFHARLPLRRVRKKIKAARLHPLAQAQSHHQRFFLLLLRRERFLAFHAVSPRRHLFAPCGRVADIFGGDALALPRSGQASMSAGADAEIKTMPPIQKIVATFFSRARMVGDFIMRQTGFGAQIARQFPLLQCGVFRRQSEFAVRMPTRIERVRFNGELIKRNVRNLLLQNAIQLAAPLRKSLTRAGIDEIGGNAGKAPSRRIQSLQSHGAVVGASESTQSGIVQRLHADGEAIDAGGAKSPQPILLNAFRIRLEADFHIGIKMATFLDGVQNGGNGRRRHQRGRAAAEENRCRVAESVKTRQQRFAFAD